MADRDSFLTNTREDTARFCVPKFDWSFDPQKPTAHVATLIVPFMYNKGLRAAA
jgi:hypothetical protein